MKKIISLALALVMLACAFASCGSSADSVKAINIDLSSEEYAFCVAQTDTELLTKVNEYLAQIKADGTFDSICNAYFGDGTPTDVISGTLDESKDQLVVATCTGFEPFEMVSGDGVYTGIDLEIANGLAAYLGKELVIQDMQFASVVTSVQQGICDIGMAGLSVTPARQEVVTFSDSYYSAAQILVVPADNTEFDACTTADEVVAILNTKTADCKIGVQNGTTGAIYVEGDADTEGGYGFPGLPATKLTYDHLGLAVNAMVNGEVDYVIGDNAPCNAIVKNVNGK